MKMDLKELNVFLDQELGIGNFPDDSSPNGLQVEGRPDVAKVAVAVDACQYVFRQAVEMDADMVFVHHGLIWGPIREFSAPLKDRLKVLFDKDISLYACHLPLDAHPVLGNNARLLGGLDIEPKGPFGGYHGKEIGFFGDLKEEIALEEFKALFDERFGGSCASINFGGTVKRVGAVSGGGWFAINDVQRTGVDTLITGEPSHEVYTLAEETGTNVVFGGHYRTETLGVRAVGDMLGKRFGLQVDFIDHPTGL